MKRQIAAIFRGAILAGTGYQLLTFVLNLTCAWLVSRLLEFTLERQWNAVWAAAAVTAAVLLISGFLLKKLSQTNSRQYQDCLQSYRQFLCRGAICRTLSVSTSGELDARLQGDATAIADFYGSACPKAVAAAATALICLALLLCADWRLALIFGGLSLLQLLPTLLYEKWAKAVYAQTRADEEAYCDWISEGLHGICTMKSYQQEPWFLKRFQAYNQAILASGKRAEKTGTVEQIAAKLTGSVLHYGSYLILGAFILFRGVRLAQAPLLLVLAQYVFSSVAALVESRIAQFQCQAAVNRLGVLEEQTWGSISGGPVVRAEKISKSFGEKKVLSNLSLEIERGARVRLLGKNGAGKTTLLRVLLGFSRPDSGSVWLDGCTKAFSFQEDPPLKIPAQAIADALAQAGTICPEDFRRHVEAFRVADVLARPPEELSAGQRKKFYLAAALARNAEFLILDEPTNHLDAESVQYLLEQLQIFSGALLVCTHDMRLALPWTKTVRMEEGTLVEA